MELIAHALATTIGKHVEVFCMPYSHVLPLVVESTIEMITYNYSG